MDVVNLAEAGVGIADDGDTGDIRHVIGLLSEFGKCRQRYVGNAEIRVRNSSST